mgnify:FL=1
MKNLFFIVYLFCLLGCKSVIKNPHSDLESIQIKTSFVDLNDNIVDLTAFKGKKIVINYWATWCGPCLKEMPGLKRAEDALKSYNYTFLLISDESVSKIAEFKKVKNYDFNFLKSIKSNETLGIYSLPTSYIFDEKGNKLETIVGTIAWDSQEIINKLKIL